MNLHMISGMAGIGGRSDAIIGTSHSWEDHDAKGIKLSKGNLADPYAKILLKWEVVKNRIRELVNEDTYLRPKAKEEYECRRLEKAQAELEAEKTVKTTDVESQETSTSETMLSPEEKLEGYLEKIENASTVDDLIDIRAEYMADEDFPEEYTDRFSEAYRYVFAVLSALCKS